MEQLEFQFKLKRNFLVVEPGPEKQARNNAIFPPVISVNKKGIVLAKTGGRWGRMSLPRLLLINYLLFRDC